MNVKRPRTPLHAVPNPGAELQPLTRQEKILVADDERPIRDLLEDFLTRAGFSVTTVSNGEEALTALARETFSIVLSDLKMPQMNGLELLTKIHEIDPGIVTIIMTGYGTLESAVAAMKQGAFDYILKPFKVDQVMSLIHRALENRRLREENLRLKEIVSLYNMSETITQSLKMDLILELALDTIYSALDADFVNILRRFDKNSPFEEVGRRSPANMSGDFLFADAVINKLLTMHAEKWPVVFDLEGCREFFGDHLCERHHVHSYLSVPIAHNNTILGLINAISLTGKHRFTEGQRKTVTLIAQRTAAALENARLYANLEDTLHQTIEGLAKAIEAKDQYTHGHSERVREYAMLISALMKQTEVEIELMGKAALLHDIGKIGVDLTYINKPGALSQEQVGLFRTHPEIGKQILSPIDSLRDIIPIVYHHHENFDGTGYPSKLKGEDIPLGARILAIADSYDAMTSDRAYRKALDYKTAIIELRRCAGVQFDPRIVETFITEIERRVAAGMSPLLIPNRRAKI